MFHILLRLIVTDCFGIVTVTVMADKIDRLRISEQKMRGYADIEHPMMDFLKVRTF